MSARKATAPTSLDELTPDARNPRKHPTRNLAMIAEALREVGAARSIVIDEKGVVLAGNGVRAAAELAGIQKMRVIEAAGDEIIAVRRLGLTDDQKTKLAMYDNRTGELAEWDWELLGAQHAAGLDLSPWFLEDELAAGLGQPLKAGNTDPDELPAARATTIKPGDLFELGKHRLLCGDSTKEADVARLLEGRAPMLMVTDPPYGVDYDPQWRLRAGVNKPHQKRAEGTVTNDNRSDWTPAWHLFPGDVVYVWHGALHASTVAVSLAGASFDVRSQLIWAKASLVIGRGHYHWKHEPCWYAVKRGRKSHWVGDRTQATLWDIPNMHRTQGQVDDGKTDHAAQKPVECMLRPMRNHAASEIYDPFLGSGTSLIAAEQLDRACVALEINPTYVQMAIDRWEAFTGQTSTSLTPRSRRRHTFTERARRS
jgi:DNA modification methylase